MRKVLRSRCLCVVLPGGARRAHWAGAAKELGCVKCCSNDCEMLARASLFSRPGSLIVAAAAGSSLLAPQCVQASMGRSSADGGVAKLSPALSLMPGIAS